MLNDPIISEVRKAREDHAAKFGYDLRAIYLDIKQKEMASKKAGWKVVSFQPKKLTSRRKRNKLVESS